MDVDIGKLASTVGPLVTENVFLLYAGFKEYWIYGSIHKRIVAERDLQIIALKERGDKWKEMALRGTATLGQAVKAADEGALLAQTALKVGGNGATT